MFSTTPWFYVAFATDNQFFYHFKIRHSAYVFNYAVVLCSIRYDNYFLKSTFVDVAKATKKRGVGTAIRPVNKMYFISFQVSLGVCFQLRRSFV